MNSSGGDSGLILMQPKRLKKLLNDALWEGVNSIVFCTIEGSPLAQVSRPGFRNTKTALVANIFYEYMDLGTHAFNNNTIENIILDFPESFVVAQNLHNHILWFFCQKHWKKGFIMNKLEALDKAIKSELEPLDIMKYSGIGVNEDEEEAEGDED